jgi:hypothetical protein
MKSTGFRASGWAMILAAAYGLAGCVVEDADESVTPSFDCTNAKGDSMLPSTTLIRNLGTETRTLTGQFGDPEHGHSITFTLSYMDVNGDKFQSVGAVTDFGRTSVTAQFDVGSATCDTGTMNNRHDCDVAYQLDVTVDGDPLCSNASFGNIHTYWRSGGF